MKFIRQTIWFVQGFAKKYKRVVLLATILSVFLLLFTLVLLPKLPKSKKSTYIGVIGKYTTNQIPAQIEAQLGMGLMKVNENQEVAMGAALETKISADGKQYEIKIRQDLVWTDGTKFKVDDINLSIPEVKITKKDNETIIFDLPEPYSPFLSILAKPFIKDGIYSLGNFNVNDVKLSGNFLNQVTLDSNDEQLIYRFYDSLGQAILAFKLGQIDKIENVDSLGELKNWPNVTISEKVANDIFVGVFYNNADPLLKDKTIRQALSYAIADKSFDHNRTWGSINPKSWAYNKNVKEYEYDLARAKELVKKSIPDNKINLELSTSAELLNIAEAIKEDWTSAGVEVEIRVVASRPTNFQALLFSQPIPDDPDQYSLWHSTQKSNFTQYESKKIDKLLEDGRQILDNEKRKLIYWDFQRFIAEDVPATFLFNPLIYTIERK